MLVKTLGANPIRHLPHHSPENFVKFKLFPWLCLPDFGGFGGLPDLVRGFGKIQKGQNKGKIPKGQLRIHRGQDFRSENILTVFVAKNEVKGVPGKQVFWGGRLPPPRKMGNVTSRARLVLPDNWRTIDFRNPVTLDFFVRPLLTLELV